MGKSAGLCGHVTCSGTRLFQEEDRKALEAARLCCNTPQQTTTGPVDTAAGFFFLGQRLWGTVSSTVLMAAWLAPPTLSENHSGHCTCPPWHLETRVLAISPNTAALQNSKITWAMAADTLVWDGQPFPNAQSGSFQGLLPRLASGGM